MKLNKFRKLSTTLLLASTMALTPITQAIAHSSHTVQDGEWLWGIARQYGVTADDIMAANGLSSEWIYPGTVLYIPSSSGYYYSNYDYDYDYSGLSSGVHVVRAGDTLTDIAYLYGVTVDQLMAWNGLGSSWLDVGDRLVLYGDYHYETPSTPSYSSYDYWYTIQPGDTLSGIAFAYGTTVENLMAINGLSSTWLIAGNKIAVPANGPVYTPPATTTPTAPWVDPSAGDGTTHIVQAGDTLSGIAATYGVYVDDLRAWNNLYSDWLDVGDVIYVGPSYSEPVVTEPTTPVVTEPINPSTEGEETEEASDASEKTVITGTSSGEGENGEEMLVSDLPEAARPDIHRVIEGDTFESIAEQYDITVERIFSWNDLEEEAEIEVGQELFVSNPLLIPIIHLIEEGDDIDSVATEYNTLPELIVEWNELEPEAPLVIGDLLVVSDPRPETHEVQPGETLEDVADLYNVTVEEIREWNGIPENVLIVNGTVVVSNPTGVTETEENAGIDTNEEETTETEETVDTEETTETESAE